MKVRASIKKMCRNGRIIKRKESLQFSGEKIIAYAHNFDTVAIDKTLKELIGGIGQLNSIWERFNGG